MPDKPDVAVSRRGFVALLGSTGLAALSGSTTAAGQTTDTGLDSRVDQYGVLVGPAGARPAASSSFFDSWDAYHFLYVASDTGSRWEIETQGGWTGPLPWRPNVAVISDPGDLPAPDSDGISTLDAGTVYDIAGTIDVTAAGIETLRVNGATVRGYHGAGDTLLTTGSGPLLQTRGGSAFVTRLALSAPAGQVFDLDAQDDAAGLADKKELLIDYSVVADASDLGQIDGYKAQSIKTCAFQDFDSGLTHTGDPQKVFYSECIFRNTANGVTAITLADALTVDVVDIAGNYFYNFGSSPTALDVVNGPEDGGTDPVARQANYTRNFHGSSFTSSNVLSGVSFETPGWRVVSSAPLADSAVLGDYSLDAGATTTISVQDTFTAMSGTTNAGATERWTQVANNEFRYDATVTEVVTVDVKASVEAPNTTIGIAIEYFDASVGAWSVLQQSEMTYETSGAGTAVAAPTGANQRFDTGDKFRVVVKDVDGTNDITVNQLNVTARGE